MTLTAEPRVAEIDLATRRRAEILYGTIRVVSRDGVVAAKLKDIAKESGVSLGLVQHYFDTRENLVDEAFGAMMLVVSRESARTITGTGDPLEFIFGMVRLHVFGSVVFPERWGFWSELWSGAGRSEHLRDVATQIYRSWAHPLEAAIRQLEDLGRIPEGADPKHLSAGILALMDGLSVRTIAEPSIYTQALMLDVLNAWVGTQLGADPAEVSRITEKLSRETGSAERPALSPEIIAAALIEARAA
ncbi:TetR family transcriptional regulator C-terminal domain-containing protein [Leucobacter sp. CSA1]|uniref:TetR family transcriptional regulator C-terminal domain-containing protein n=1 Tax=Leucobacter chromiisoli TaxID=2796471 RepID=A0A934UTS1_9MICO|nr:TetR family transcriptional regulator C-terminal domain-containing protein [Leucobacter chromiisoli]MBK0417651.1 TetR family transcriptional regulator C-terminal domain-containing protein [Leucobacter chromiisoli]